MHHRSLAVLLAVFLLAACQSEKAPVHRGDTAARQDSLFRRDAPTVLAEVKAMIDADQAIRHLYEYNTTDEQTADSLSEVETAARMHGEAWGIRPGDPLYKLRVSPQMRRFKDSLEKEMIALSSRHTARVVALMLRYGYPSSHRLDSTTNIDPFILLHHPDSNFRLVVMPLLTRELALARMDTNGYEMIRWTFGGRQGLPMLPRMKVDSSVRGVTSITIQ